MTTATEVAGAAGSVTTIGRPNRPQLPQGYSWAAEAVQGRPDKVRVMGIELPRATLDPRVKESAPNFALEEFASKRAENMARAFAMQQPFLMVGGTDIGKSEVVFWMAEQMNAEVYKVDLNGQIDKEDLFGRTVPNKKRAHDPNASMYVEVHGPIRQAMTPETEDGKTKVKILFLDEYNAMRPNIAIAMHGVLDALRRGQTVSFGYDDDPDSRVTLDPKTTFVVGAMNTGKDYEDRFKIDAANLRRWQVDRLPDDLPEATILHRLTTNYSEQDLAYYREKPVAIAALRPNRETPLTLEELQRFDYMRDNYLKQYVIFHKIAASAVTRITKRKINNWQTKQEEEVEVPRLLKPGSKQAFAFTDGTDTQRVMIYLQHFLRPGMDLSQAFRDAIDYVYCNKIADQEGREELQKLAAKMFPDIGVQFEDKVEIIPAEDLPTLELSPEALIHQDEANKWKAKLGIDQPLDYLMPEIPSSITPEVRKKLDEMGMDLVFLPNLAIGLNGLQNKSPAQFVSELTSEYPHWKNPLPAGFWQDVKEGKVAPDQVQLPGKWVAIERIKKPNKGEAYADVQGSLAALILLRQQRKGVSYNEIQQAIQANSANVIASLGLSPSARVKLPTALQMNLYGNREEEWSKTTSAELTETFIDGECVFLGDASIGGAKGIDMVNPTKGKPEIGFRLMIELE